MSSRFRLRGALDNKWALDFDKQEKENAGLSALDIYWVLDNEWALDNIWASSLDSQWCFRTQFTKRYRLKIWSLENEWACNLDRKLTKDSNLKTIDKD